MSKQAPYENLELKANNSEPLYRQLEKLIRSAIVGGEFNPGDKIETEEELSERFQVSRITVRNAISILVEDGLLIKQQGKGTFVSKPKYSRDIIHVINFTLNCEINGKRPGCETIYLKAVEPSLLDIEFFGIGEKEKVIELKRVRRMGDDPVVIEIDTFPPKFIDLLKKKVFNESLYAYIKEHYGLVATKASKTLEMTVATKSEADMLEIPNGSPLFLMKGTVKDQNGKPLHRSIQKIVGDRYKFLIESD